MALDVRVLAATNRDLAEDVRAGRFREDLLYRLNVVTLVIPPLRKRQEDVPELTGAFVRHLRERLDRREVRGVSPEAMELLLGHDWPGNVRELLNALERAVLLCRGERIQVTDLPPTVRTAPASAGSAGSWLAGDAPCPGSWLSRPLRDVRDEVARAAECAYLTAQLEHAKGRVGETARRCGISERALHQKMKRHGLRKESFR